MGNRGRQLSKKQRDPAPFSEEKWIAKKEKTQTKKSMVAAPKKPIVKNKKRKSDTDESAPSKKTSTNKKQKTPIYESEEE
jgi:hypothetical protein